MNWYRRGILCFMFLLLSVSGQEEEKTPTLTILAKTRIFNIYDKRAIYCKGTNLKERIEWYSPTNELITGRSVKNNRIFVERLQEDSLELSLIPLIIQSLQIKDSGNWTCRSGNLSATIDLFIGDKVEFATRNESIEAEEGKTIRIHCEGKGYPEPEVRWLKGIVAINDDKKYHLGSFGTDFYLEIRNLNHQDSGRYSCKMLQPSLLHFAEKIIWLNVQHKPLLVDAATQEVTYEKFRSEEVFAILDETKNITCAVLAYPLPTYAWYRRKKSFDEPIRPEDMVLTAKNSSYSVLKLRIYNTSYLGQYVCSATNPKGKASVLYHVSLGNKPDAPDMVGVLNASTDSITFNVSCSTCYIKPKDSLLADDPKNLTLLGFSFLFAPVVERYAEADWDGATEIGVDIVDPEDTIFIVGPLHNNTNFYARVRSRNAAGFSEWVNVPETVSTTDLAVRLMDSIFVVIFSLLLFFVF